MDFLVKKATLEDKDIFKNLMQFYFYDFSEYVEAHVEEDGRFGDYPYLENYWNEESRFPYLIEYNGKHAGFALVRRIESEEKAYYSIAEFFVMKKYRFSGLGKLVAHQLFDLHKGIWEVFQIAKNEPAQIFWRKAINEYTKGTFTERKEESTVIQGFTSY
ncbi:GNAT family N-acetyltransferase [Pseudalkalibacillus decolorationis]|uniref:GNAT family N-acetyltransferase n=1 Tax=Pseudalkalibacillus decolorationis TaxID=163879 RepID=UPI00214825A7|nr:GNAT family N-acetyltransferase [Pseudalkalibacillus decolorationis]